MAIIRKTDLQRHIQELDDRYQALKKAAVGGDPNPNIFEQYSVSPDDYKEHFTEVDVASVEYALHDFKGVLNQLGKIKSLQAHRLKSHK